MTETTSANDKFDESGNRVVYTIGHSNHSLSFFLQLLAKHRISAIADVRSSPFSRHNPQFNRDRFARALKADNIAYVFVGKELGARSDDPSCYEGGQVQYERLARTTSFHSGIARVLRGTKSYRIAVMCAEKEPLDCHRTLLVARALVREGTAVRHILADGRLEDHGDSMARLLELVGLPQEDMFRSRESLVDEACRLRERAIAYVDETLGDVDPQDMRA